MAKTWTMVLVKTPSGIVMINRQKPPYRGLWNGVGGKVDPGETPQAGALREVEEETGLALTPADLRPAGVMHWHVNDKWLGDVWLFVARSATALPGAQMTREGVLATWSREWLLASDNLGIVPDLQPLLPHLLGGEQLEFDSWFADDLLQRLEVLGPWA
ncbi:NUDIX hydrolase [Lacticaseibacillus absianus]|uniref:NUDIX hydrolase n=1 Tax=Lacticaseibacillus absianus TaxID=2729623 RepID=UPI0015CD4ECA|nr:8-oxo-dGTP diphosphatase [Lacticaseibacillus absianus]